MLKQYIEAIEKSNIVSKTDTAGIITFVNDEFCKISGYTKEELIGKDHNIVRHPDVAASKFKLLWDTIQNKETYKATVKNLAKDGSIFYVNTTVTPILDENNNIVEYIAIRYDVTKEIMLQEELEEKQKMIFWQSRLASLGQMLANIAHQWRQPLTELSLTTFNMKKSSLNHENENVLKFYNESKNIIKNMSNTIDDFRNFFKPENKKVIFDISKQIKYVVNILENNLKKQDINLDVNFEKLILIEGYPNELGQVLLNIINNARDALVEN
ncbi:MAG: PAS domain S-box protein, partial [Arcobacteraceae bacterium]|nr:PAS domain S-box protein [Arcobacteraceae bacterium]